MLKNIALEEAQELLLQKCPVVGTEKSTIHAALGRILCEDIHALENIPPFPRSPYDGYAFRAEDTLSATTNNPARLEIIEEIPAGKAPEQRITTGKAAKILTGAPIPEGASSVTKYEETELQGKHVLIFDSFQSGENIVPPGEDVKQDEIIASKGTVITPPIMGLMAGLGISEVPIYQRLKVGIVSTGDELVDVTEKLTPGKIRNSNSYTLLGYISAIGAEPIIIGTAKDQAQEVASLIQLGLERADIVITTGGVSVGDYDVVKDAVRLVEAETLYWKIEIKPGSPTLAAVKNGKIIIGLSGNPAAAMVILQLLGIPFMKKTAGRADYLNRKIEVILLKDFKKASPRRRFLRGKLVFKDGLTYMETTGAQGNGVLRSMIDCNVLAEIPAGSGPVKAGEKLTAYIVD